MFNYLEKESESGPSFSSHQLKKRQYIFSVFQIVLSGEQFGTNTRLMNQWLKPKKSRGDLRLMNLKNVIKRTFIFSMNRNIGIDKKMKYSFKDNNAWVQI